jgi:signal transduction histidine kinase
VYKQRDSMCDVCPVAKTFEDGETHTSEEVVTSRTGEEIHVLVRTAPLRNASGEIEEVMEMSTNITEIRRMQSQLTSLGMMISSISHRVKGLLTGVDGGIYVANSALRKNDQEQVREGLEIVQRNSQRIRKVILDVLFYSKERELVYRKTSALELAAEVSNSVDHLAESLGIELRRDFDVAAGWFLADPDHLRTALANMLENAFDACRIDPAKPSHVVTFGFRSWAGDRVVFEVTDNGVGMDETTQAKVFDLFYSTKGCEGTGIGMYVCAEVVKQHGGTIELASVPGEGTRIVVTLPVSPPQGAMHTVTRAPD